MSGLSPARLLAPLALVVTALALIVVLASGGGSSSPAGATQEPTATATSSAKQRSSSRERRSTGGQADDASDDGDTAYTVKAGDSPSSIAAAEGVSVDELLEANPDVDPNALAVGDELEIPRG